MNHENELESVKDEDVRVLELKKILDSDKTDDEKRDLLYDYHENDIATVVEGLTKEERIELYKILGTERTAEVFSYLENVDEFVDELEYDKAADIIEQMDADDAVDVLDTLEEEDKHEIIKRMDDEAASDIKLIESYDDDMVGSKMTTNYIKIPHGYTVRQAMKELVAQAAENDNISTLYVTDDDKLYGTIDLKDLIIARSGVSLDEIIKTNYPSLLDTKLISDCINDIREYDLDSIPVVDSNYKLVGVITSSDIIETIDEELSEDYAKLGGLSEEENLDEPIHVSIKKRIPWLVLLMFLGLLVSTVTGKFEGVIASLSVMVFFQSMVLDMAGNVGTQSLAVTIRAISDGKKNIIGKLIWKEIRIGFVNGIILGLLACAFVTLYLGIQQKPIGRDFAFSWLESFKAGGIVGASLLVAMTASSFTGTAFPILLTKVHVDPAVASGPFITTLNDILAIAIYYALAMLLFAL